MAGLLAPKVPKPSAPPPAPDPDEEGPVSVEARRKRIGKRQAEGGRASTILTSGIGGDYSAGPIG
jgi:hypothetical protein